MAVKLRKAAVEVQAPGIRVECCDAMTLVKKQENVNLWLCEPPLLESEGIGFQPGRWTNGWKGEAEYSAWWKEVAKDMLEATHASGSLVVYGSVGRDFTSFPCLFGATMGAGWSFANWIIADGTPFDYSHNSVQALWFYKTIPDSPVAGGKTVEERLVLAHSQPGELIVDPFCGSGATLRSAVQHGRRVVGGDADIKWANYCLEQSSKWSLPHR
jgi:hypothetical protein